MHEDKRILYISSVRESTLVLRFKCNLNTKKVKSFCFYQCFSQFLSQLLTVYLYTITVISHDPFNKVIVHYSKLRKQITITQFRSRELIMRNSEHVVAYSRILVVYIIFLIMLIYNYLNSPCSLLHDSNKF